MVSLRWAFNYGCWRPTLNEWITLMAAIQSEERNRINRFHFQHHAKAALVSAADSYIITKHALLHDE